MIQLTPKIELMIRIFIILILIGLNFAIYWNGKDLSCNQCTIEFSSYKRPVEGSSLATYQEFSFHVNDLYSNLTEEHCLVKFDKDGGYIYNQLNGLQ